MNDKFPSPDPHNNHSIRHETLPSQHEGALRAYYWSVDRVMQLPDGGDSIEGIVTRLLEDHYEVSDAQAEQLLGESSVDLPLASSFEDEDMQRINKETLLLFPLLELGSFVDESYEPAVSAEWYTQVAAAILERTRDVHSSNCLRYSEAGCADGVRCPWRVVADVLTRQASDPNFASIEYVLEPERQIEMVTAKLVAARADGLEYVHNHDIDDIAGFYQALTKSLHRSTADESQETR
jgi:hypothetical protein